MIILLMKKIPLCGSSGVYVCKQFCLNIFTANVYLSLSASFWGWSEDHQDVLRGGWVRGLPRGHVPHGQRWGLDGRDRARHEGESQTDHQGLPGWLHKGINFISHSSDSDDPSRPSHVHGSWCGRRCNAVPAQLHNMGMCFHFLSFFHDQMFPGIKVLCEL